MTRRISAADVGLARANKYGARRWRGGRMKPDPQLVERLFNLYNDLQALARKWEDSQGGCSWLGQEHADELRSTLKGMLSDL